MAILLPKIFVLFLYSKDVFRLYKGFTDHAISISKAAVWIMHKKL